MAGDHVSRFQIGPTALAETRRHLRTEMLAYQQIVCDSIGGRKRRNWELAIGDWPRQTPKARILLVFIASLQISW